MPFSTRRKNSDSAADQSMHFWGVCCESGKQYAQVVGQRFRITMAVLDPKSSSREVNEKTVSLIVIRGGIEYLLCVLKHEEIHQVNLNLIFDKGENVVFYINGHGKVYLSGYQLTDSESDVLNDENGYLCPLVEVKLPKSKTEKKGKVSKTPQMSESELVTPKSKRKAKANKKDLVASDERRSVTGLSNAFPNKKKNGELDILEALDSDESDEDYSVGDEESESESGDSEEYLDDEELRGGGIQDLKTYKDDDEEEDDEDDDDDEEEEEVEQEVIFDSKKSQKRKLTKALQPQKRPRNDSFTSILVATEKSEDSSESVDSMNSSIGNTPMPKKQKKLETSSEKKASKKKKRLSEISILSEKSVKGQLKSPFAESTPNRGSKYPVQKLEGGVEVQDVIVGKGPTATKGKMVHIYYLGRFQNHKIFDSRIAGKKPFAFKLGAQQVIKGWDIGIQGMKVGGKRKLKVPANMGYGNTPVEGIPPNSVLYFIVELHAVS